MNRDVLIVGAGPAGLSAAAACAAVGLRAAVIAPDPDAAWVPTYAAWPDEVPDDVPFDVTWPEVEVRFSDAERHRMARRYGRIDGAALRARLWDQCSGIEVLRGAVVEIGGDEAGTSSARDDRGRVHLASVLLDATGAAGRPEASAFQTAHGVFAQVDGMDAVPRWMDFSAAFGDGDEPPSFLYALPLPDGTWLLEETALVRAPALPHELLHRRLEQRLGAMGVRIRRVAGTERVTIPMDVPDDAPSRAGTVRFGAAAGMIHPATGYLVPRLLAAAPRVAHAVADHLHLGGGPAALAAQRALWPTDTLRRHRLYRFGASAVAGLGADDTRAFFRAFFAMPPAFVEGYLGDRLTTAELVRGMTVLFGRLPARLRWRIVAGGSTRDLVRAVFSRTERHRGAAPPRAHARYTQPPTELRREPSGDAP